ncbi:MAG: type II secretion system protein GspC [Myxococcota bacterium]
MNPNLMGGILAAATLISAGTAYGVNQVIATQLAPEVVAEEAAPPEAPAAAPRVARRGRGRRVPTAEEYLDGIMRRNIFDVSVIESWDPQPEESAGGAQETPLRVRLLGTVVANDPRFSSALIASEDEPYSKGYSIGDALADRTIVEIIKGKVKLERSDGAFEWLSIDDEEGKRVTASTQREPEGDDDSGVQQTSDNRFSVSRDLFDKYINDMESITKLGRALLHRGPDGSFDGYRLAAIRRNTLADQLGIKNGDIIHSVNGEPLTSLQAAMNAYNTMQSESNFCFEITRRRKPVELCYDVR